MTQQIYDGDRAIVAEYEPDTEEFQVLASAELNMLADMIFGPRQDVDPSRGINGGVILRLIAEHGTFQRKKGLTIQQLAYLLREGRFVRDPEDPRNLATIKAVLRRTNDAIRKFYRSSAAANHPERVAISPNGTVRFWIADLSLQSSPA